MVIKCPQLSKISGKFLLTGVVTSTYIEFEMTDLQAAIDQEQREAVAEFDRGITTEVTQVDEDGPREHRPATRSPEDGQAETITLKRASGPGRGAAAFSGPEAWYLADQMLAAWIPRRGTVEIAFGIRFGDGELYHGKITLPAGRRRPSLSAHCRKSETFRACFCADLNEKQAAALFRVFLSLYEIGRKTDA